jgi:hypothetical protein
MLIYDYGASNGKPLASALADGFGREEGVVDTVISATYCIGVLISCATPAASWPIASSSLASYEHGDAARFRACDGRDHLGDGQRL